ncbi:MAG: UDP-N-acetylmuramoyl-tripeptide--D-alanyl-D-alanine ligase, partial [Oleiphilaceae bacterium]|nr:UDP-N-acetylmuramoyl-tripeptide--D-alanyl-D-alanine ligase [Oleiphilaceae bacterium]
PQLVVANTLTTLGQLGAMNRANFKGTEYGITGSAGKTTCKGLLHEIVSLSAETAATAGNFNNEIGVPLTLLALREDQRFAVIEMGARKKGDIAYLMELVRPDVAILLNAGSAHIDIFGSYENIVATKGEIFAGLAPEGCGVVNLDDPAANEWLRMLGSRKHLCFSMQPGKADVWSEDIDYFPDRVRFTLCTREQSRQVEVRIPGIAGVANSLAAATAALAVGLDFYNIINGLQNFEPGSGRLQSTQLGQGTLVIDDSYNANPASMKAALDVLAIYEQRRIAVLGEMAELGAHAHQAHMAVAEQASRLGLDAVLLQGPFAEDMAQVIGESAVVVTDKDGLWAALTPLLRGDEVVLVKGSRCAGLDSLVAQMKEELA